tara:strand:- start:4 stop:411 length:408 start_codon:yes stop_codon:yes gene_type:complete
MLLDQEEQHPFVVALAETFPEVEAEPLFDDGLLLHLSVGAFEQLSLAAFNRGDILTVRKYFAFVELCPVCTKLPYNPWQRATQKRTTCHVRTVASTLLAHNPRALRARACFVKRPHTATASPDRGKLLALHPDDL